jgi:hypothetical protein
MLCRRVLVSVIHQYNDIVAELERRGPLLINNPESGEEELNPTWAEAVDKIEGTFLYEIITLVLILTFG